MNVRVWSATGPLQGVRRTGGEARELINRSTEPLALDFYPRSDGPGSSQDLPQFLAAGLRVWRGPAALDDPVWQWSRGCLRTPGACIDSQPIRFEAELASSEAVAQYFAHDFHKHPVTSQDVVPGVPDYFVNNILVQFGLRGIRIVATKMPAVYRGTGLGGSNLAHAAALIFASSLSGVDLSLAQIYIWGTFLENHFGTVRSADGKVSHGLSVTGGQEMLTAFQGGLFDNVHVPQIFGPHAVVSRELVSPENYAELENHLALVNLGHRRPTGITSAGVNNQWMAAWAVPEQAVKHLQKARLAYEGAEALRTLDFRHYAEVIRQYREIRSDLSSLYTAGQAELERLCDTHRAQYFPVGAGGGTCLVCAPESTALRSLISVVERTADPNAGRVAIPFRVRQEGVQFTGFESRGLALPSLPESISGKGESAGHRA